MAQGHINLQPGPKAFGYFGPPLKRFRKRRALLLSSHVFLCSTPIFHLLLSHWAAHAAGLAGTAGSPNQLWCVGVALPAFGSWGGGRPSMQAPLCHGALNMLGLVTTNLPASRSEARHPAAQGTIGFAC